MFQKYALCVGDTGSRGEMWVYLGTLAKPTRHKNKILLYTDRMLIVCSTHQSRLFAYPVSSRDLGLGFTTPA